MSFTLSNNFLLNSRGLSWADGGGIVWTFNKNTNTISANFSDPNLFPLSTGWGTPVNGAVQNNFDGSAATLAETRAAVAELIANFIAAGAIAA